MSAFPWARPSPLALPDRYGHLLTAAPVSRARLESGTEVWIVAGHALFREALLNPALSADHAHPAYPTMTPVRRRRTRHGSEPQRGYSGMDAPEHTAHRRLAGALFSRSAAEQVRPVVGRVIEERLDVLVRGTKPADLVTGFADPVAALVITEVLGIRQKDRLSDLSRVLVDRHTSPQTVAQASVEIRARIAEEVRAVENHASDDTLLHRLVGRYQRAGCYDRDQVVELVGSLIIAGHETTASMIALGVLALLSHPDQLGALRADPAGVPSAVEELLRYLSVADLVTTRVTTGPVRLGDAVLPSGAGVVLSGGAANHDPRVFEHPERLDITRDTRGHVAFGYGVHRCIGQHLARVELTSACVRLFERLPHLRLADTDAPARSRERAALHGLASLTVTW